MTGAPSVGADRGDPCSVAPREVAEVALVVLCRESDYRAALSAGFIPSLARMHCRQFSEIVVVVGAVADRDDARSRAQTLQDAHEITRFAFAPFDERLGPAVAAVVTSPWLLGWGAAATPARPTSWIDPAIDVLEAEPWILHVTLNREPAGTDPVFDGRAGAVGTIGDYSLDWGFDQDAFLMRRADLARVAGGFAPAVLGRLDEGDTGFERRVECFQRSRHLSRATLTTASLRVDRALRSSPEPGRLAGPLASSAMGLVRRAVGRTPGWLGPRYAVDGALPAPTPRVSSPQAGSRTRPATGPVISLLHATYHRADGPLAIRDEWLGRSDRPEAIEYIVAMDEGDLCALAQTVGCTRVVSPRTVSVSAVRNWNAAAAAATGSLLVVIADDLVPREGWDSRLRAVVGSLAPDRDHFVIKVSDKDGHPDLLLRHPVVSRGYYTRFGLFSRAFTGVYCDDDLTRRALVRSVILDGRQVRVDHEHPPNEDLGALSVSQRRINAENEYRVGYDRFCLRWPKPVRSIKVRAIAPGTHVGPTRLVAHRWAVRLLGVADVAEWAARAAWRRVR